MRLVRRCAAALVLCLIPTISRADSPVSVPPPPPSLLKQAPDTLDDLKAIQEQTKKVLKRVIACTVGLQVRGAAGSGVIVSEDGTVLTAGHVVGEANQDCRVIMPDGRVLKGKTLGANRTIDSGMIKITDPGKWPFVELGESKELKLGEWVLAIGHPGGYKAGRSPVVRVGRISRAGEQLLQTDCTLVGGDSGGPLFDMTGKLIGIHSRISGPITTNIHVPVDTYRDTWERLAKAEVWGRGFGGRDEGYLGIECDGNTCKITKVTSGSPAEKAGLQVGDLILRFDENTVKSWDDLGDRIFGKRVGQEVAIEIRRGSEERTLRVKIGRRAAQ
ncbi:MAG TPA: trypsin-like peptidase domain-containing protein [Gemmataceae bacterium]|nr:trypsin-like peptidase domain-containing protein [Gemmataceae bacterium]